MPSTLSNYINKLFFILLVSVLPLMGQAQTSRTDVKILNQKIDKLSKMLIQLKTEQHRSRNIEIKLETPLRDYTRLDSMRLVALRRKQADSRARIDILTLEIIKLGKQLEDPRKRYALAKHIQDHRVAHKSKTSVVAQDISPVEDIVTGRSIDFAAVKLVRQGKSLDQARLLTIEKLSFEQVLTFYRELPKTERYKLYDIADEIAENEDVDLTEARRSAMYFHLFAK